jgi:phage tail-like protein
MTPDAISRLLPYVFQRAAQPGGLLAGLVGTMSALHEPSEAVLRDVDRYFDPRRAPDAFVPMLARWVDLDWVLEPHRRDEDAPAEPLASGIGCLRELVAAAPHLARWRGTERGLVALLETAVGVRGFAVDAGPPDASGRVRPFHVRVLAPAAARPFESLIRRLVDVEKPAYATCAVTFVDGPPPR